MTSSSEMSWLQAINYKKSHQIPSIRYLNFNFEKRWIYEHNLQTFGRLLNISKINKNGRINLLYYAYLVEK